MWLHLEINICTAIFERNEEKKKGQIKISEKKTTIEKKTENE